jgi:hypothetical protein
MLENRDDSYQSRCQLIITTVESLVQCYTSGGRFDQSSLFQFFPFVKTQGHSSLRRMQCPFSIRHEVLPDVNCQLRGFDDDVDVFSQLGHISSPRVLRLLLD